MWPHPRHHCPRSSGVPTSEPGRRVTRSRSRGHMLVARGHSCLSHMLKAPETCQRGEDVNVSITSGISWGTHFFGAEDFWQPRKLLVKYGLQVLMRQERKTPCLLQSVNSLRVRSFPTLVFPCSLCKDPGSVILPRRALRIVGSDGRGEAARPSAGAAAFPCASPSQEGLLSPTGSRAQPERAHSTVFPGIMVLLALGCPRESRA